MDVCYKSNSDFFNPKFAFYNIENAAKNKKNKKAVIIMITLLDIFFISIFPQKQKR